MLLSACHQIMGISRHFIKISYKKQPTQNIALINNFCKKNPERKCSENFYFGCYFLNLNNFENFKYPQFVWSSNFTYDDSFIFHPQCHALASLFLNMPKYSIQSIFQGYHVQPIVMDTNTPSVPRVASPVDSTVSQSAGASRRSLSYADTARSTVMPSDTPVWSKKYKKQHFFLPSYFTSLPQNML